VPHDADGRPLGVRGLVRDHALTMGLAASSIALLLAARGGTDAVTAPDSDVLTPPEKRAEEKGPTWDLQLSEHERVDFFIEYLMGKNHDRTREWLERIGKYGPLIQNELRERGMPEDLLYLTIIESGLDPNAFSKAHAAGLWQFIKETGQRYGLEVSPYVDERRDPVKSTAAALSYLQEMHERFGSWYLSAAGYNTGENRVARLLRAQIGSEKGADESYWDIWDSLPEGTRQIRLSRNRIPGAAPLRRGRRRRRDGARRGRARSRCRQQRHRRPESAPRQERDPTRAAGRRARAGRPATTGCCRAQWAAHRLARARGLTSLARPRHIVNQHSSMFQRTRGAPEREGAPPCGRTPRCAGPPDGSYTGRRP
jgi:hypothetical protein